MRADFRLYTLNADEFEGLSVHMATHLLGEGVAPFAPGKDGGRDGKFHGTAERFPSRASPLVGHVVLQAKHVSSPDKSCSDNDFVRLIKKEHQKIKRLIKEGICDHYIVFTNRKCSGGADEKLTKELLALGLKTAHVLGTEYIHKLIEQNCVLQSHLPTAKDVWPFRFDPAELIEVIHAFHEYAGDVSASDFLSDYDFDIMKMRKKNEINSLTEDYYQQVIKADSIPHFHKIKEFLANPRNQTFAALYADAAGELKQKIIIHRAKFTNFDHVFGFLCEEIQAKREALRGRRRLVSILLHYMYFHCDIGSKKIDTEPEVADANS